MFERNLEIELRSLAADRGWAFAAYNVAASSTFAVSESRSQLRAIVHPEGIEKYFHDRLNIYILKP